MARVLIVEDDPETRDPLGMLLTMDGHDVLMAGHGDEALDLHRGWHADVIVLDMLMPRRDGLETIVELRRHFPDVKIVAISGHDTLLDAAVRDGANAKLLKPFHPSALADAIRAVMSKPG